MTAKTDQPDSPHRASLLERPGPWGSTVALLVLMGFFFILPSALRGARMALKNKENDVKDWLPSDFPETAELDWFADHFAGESFVLATWPGCNEGDQRLRVLEQKLLRESASYHDVLLAERSIDGESLSDAEIEMLIRARELGEELQLLQPGQDLEDWGGENEKWLASAGGQWYYITPDGRFYRWDGSLNGPAALWRSIQRRLGTFKLDGQLVTAVGKPSTPERVNRFYNDPSLLAAPLFETVQTGATIADELSAEGGALWPVDLTDTELRAQVAKRRAYQRLTGTLFAPAVPPDFDWTAQAFAKVLSEEQRAELPPGYEVIVQQTLQSFAQRELDGDINSISHALSSLQTDAWYEVFDALSITPPARLTCLLVTLTDLAKDNLAYAVGRGVLGSPQGRLLVLANESGVHPPPEPSTLPPPFNREPPDTVGMAPPLHMGGPPIDNIAIDEEGTVTLVRLIGYCILVGVLLSYFCFRSLKITVMLFIVGGSAAILAMAFVGWSGGRVDAILMSMPSLVYVLGLSGSIHVINYYRDEVRNTGQRGAATRALKHAALPCTLAAFTTAIGLASLYTSNLRPISNFGLYSAIGVLATLGILFSYLPAALEVFTPKFGRKRGKQSGAENSVDGNTDQGNSDLQLEMARWWEGVGRLITSHHRAFSIGCLLFLAIASLGLLRITTSVQLLKLFDPNARILRDYAWLEENFGNLVPMEIIVRMPPSLQKEHAQSSEADQQQATIALSLLERIETVARIRTVVTRALGEEGSGEIGQASSMDTFLPPLPPVKNGWDLVRSSFNKRINESKDELLKGDYVKIEKAGPLAGSELWRLSLRVSALSDNDYGLFIGDLQDAVAPVVNAYETRQTLISTLAADDGKLTGRQRVLVLGSQRPERLTSARLTDEEGNLLARSIYLSTLSELLDGESLKRTAWIDPDSADAKIKPGDANWDKMLASVDAVVWLGGSSTPDWLAAAQTVIPIGDVSTTKHDKQIVTLTDDLAFSNGRIPVFHGTESGVPQVVFTGVVPVVYKAQRTLLGSLVESIVLAFVLIAGVMMVLLNPGRFPLSWLRPTNFANGLAAGAVSMIPNMFPVLLVFGLMGHGKIAVDIGTMMTASVAMGVAVDDTIHFLSWFRQFLEMGKSRVDAVIATYRKVGPAMTQTTIVGGLGLFIFALSTFTPTQRFGTLMLVMLATALVGDLILLPALLVGPLGKCFKPREQFQTSPTVEADDVALPEPSVAAPDETAESVLAADDSVPVLRVHVPPATRKDKAHRTTSRK